MSDWCRRDCRRGLLCPLLSTNFPCRTVNDPGTAQNYAGSHKHEGRNRKNYTHVWPEHRRERLQHQVPAWQSTSLPLSGSDRTIHDLFHAWVWVHDVAATPGSRSGDQRVGCSLAQTIDLFA